MKDENDNKAQELIKVEDWPFPMSDYFKKEKPMNAIQYIEEVKEAPIDADSILTDEQLQRGGLVKIEAFVRTKTSAAASRKAKQRAREKAEGIQTVTLTVPAEAKAQLKAITAEIANGKTVTEAIQNVTCHGQVTKSKAQVIGERVLALTGWRLVIAKAIGII